MADHRFDPVAFVFGALAVACGAVVLADRSLTEDARVLLPAGLIAVGLALLVRVMGTSGPRPATPADRDTDSGSIADAAVPSDDPGPDAETIDGDQPEGPAGRM